jgi:hypothetical protein
MQLWSSILATALGATVSPISDRTPDALQGEWVSDCAPVRPNSSKGSIIRVTIRGSKISAMGQVFATTKCEVPTLRGGFSGTIRRVNKVGERWELDYVVGETRITLQRRDVVDYYNKSAGCGLNQWHLNTAKAVAGRRCGFLDVPPSGQRLFEAVWTDGDKLRMGAFPLNTMNRSPQARPTFPGPLVLRRMTNARR